MKTAGYILDEREIAVRFPLQTTASYVLLCPKLLKTALCPLAVDEIMTRVPAMTVERIPLTPGIHWMSHDPFLSCVKFFFCYENYMDYKTIRPLALHNAIHC
jgi:hypothetical protein